MTFTSYAQGGSFRPKKTTDYLPALKENQDRQRRDEQVYFDQMRANDQTKVRNAEKSGDGLKALGKFSKTLSTVLAEDEERRNEEDLNEGIALAYEESMFGPGTPERTALDVGEEALKADDAQIQLAAGSVLAMNPENYQAATRVKELSGWKKYGYATGLAQMAGNNYQTWMDNAMRTDETTQITVNGVTFTPAQATDPAQKQAAMGVLRRQYLKQAGVSELSKPLLAKYAFEPMYKADATMIGQARRDYAIAQSEVDAGEADNALFATKDLGSYLTSLSTTVDSNGKMRGFGGAWTEAMSRIEKGVQAGLLTQADLNAMKLQEQGDTGKTFGELHQTKFALLEQKIQDQEVAAYNRSNQQQELARNQAESQIIDQLMSQENITADDIEAAEAKLDEIYPGVDSSRLNSIKTSQTLGAMNLKDQEKELKQLADAGLLTPERLSKFHWSLQQQYSNIASMQKEATPQIKKYHEAIEKEVKSTVGVTPQSKADGTVTLMIDKVKADFDQAVAQAMIADPTLTAEQASLTAYAEIERKLKEGKAKADKDPTNPYASSGTKGYPNLLPPTTDKSNAASSASAEIERIKKSADGSGGKKAFFTVPNLIYSQPELEAFEDQINSGTFETPPRAAYFAREYNFNDPLELINAQRTAAGMEPMNVPASVEAVRQGVNPELQKFLYNYPTEQRQTRALSSMGRFEPSVIPNGYGDAIAQAAEANGIPPSILAGLIEQESGWNPTAVSSAGAVGLGQFMPDTAAEWEVDRKDPVSSINGAAKYLRYLTDYFDGDLDKAIYAYNGGMGNIERRGVGFDGPGGENYEYHRHVMQRAAKYGYGQLPVRSSLKTQS